MTTVITATIPLTIDRFMHEHIRQLIAAGEDVVVVSSPGARLDRIQTAFPQVTIEAIPMTRAIAPGADIAALVTWIRLLRRIQPSRILSKSPKSSLLSMLAGRLLRVPRRTYASGGLRLEGASGLTLALLTLMERLTCWASTEVVANSPSLGEQYLRRRLVAPAKLRTTQSGQGVDSSWFRPTAAEPMDLAAHGLNPLGTTIGFVGRLTADKGAAALVSALEIAKDSRLQLLVVGPQDEPDSLQWKHRLSTLELPVAVIDTIDDVRPVLAAIDLIVLPSVREGFPNVILEAAAMEVPAVTTDATGCIDSVVHGVTGFIVPVGDSVALARAIDQLASDQALRKEIGRAARIRVVTEYRSTSVVAQTLAIKGRVP